MGLSVEKLSEMLGTKVTTLLGTDILANYKILFDYRNKSVIFSKEKCVFNGEEVKISSFMGIPIIELFVNNQKLKFFLDTGAKLSYLSNNFTANYHSIGREVDFYPGVGEFETECYEILTKLGDREFSVKYGNLPDLLEMTLMLGGTNGIIGFDLFNSFKVFLDINNRTLRFGDNSSHSIDWLRES